MKNKLFVWVAVALLFASCKPSNEPEEPAVKNEVTVTVYNTKTWSVTNPKMEIVSGASVHLSSQSETLEAKTNDKGVAIFSNVKEGGYSILTVEGDLSNLVNKKITNGVTYGHLIAGVYQSQEDIDGWAYYPHARLGGIKLVDFNGDALIDDMDLVKGTGFGYEFKYKDLNEDGIIDAKDFINGSLQKIDNQVKVTVYIGN